MEFTLKRYEKYKDKDGNIISIFVAVEIKDDDGNLLTHGYQLNQDEIDAVLEDENNLVPILENVVAEGIIRLKNEIANKPQPPEIADNEKRRNILSKLNNNNINKKVEKLEKKQNEEII